MNIYVRQSLFTAAADLAAECRLSTHAGVRRLHIAPGLHLSTDLVSGVFARQVQVEDANGHPHDTLEVCRVIQLVPPQGESGWKIVYRVMDYGCCPETQHNRVVVAETGGVRYVNIPIGIDNRRSRCLRVLAYERRAHPLAAWVVPLKLRLAGPYVAEPRDVLCKLRVVELFSNLWWVLHGVERYECPGPAGDMEHEEYLAARNESST